MSLALNNWALAYIDTFLLNLAVSSKPAFYHEKDSGWCLLQKADCSRKQNLALDGGALRWDFTINLSSQCMAFSTDLKPKKLKNLAIPRPNPSSLLDPVGTGTTNDCCTRKLTFHTDELT